MQTMSASEFKATCLEVLDRVARTGERVTITKRGRAVAQLVPATGTSEVLPQKRILGQIECVGDVVSPVLPADAWNAVRGEGS
jgi:prevent-host-death family protein